MLHSRRFFLIVKMYAQVCEPYGKKNRFIMTIRDGRTGFEGYSLEKNMLMSKFLKFSSSFKNFKH